MSSIIERNNTNLTVSRPLNTIRITSVSTVEAQKFVKTDGLTTGFLKANGDVDSNQYVKTGTLTALSVPYFTSTNTLSGSTRNLFIELGVNTIQVLML